MLPPTLPAGPSSQFQRDRESLLWVRGAPSGPAGPFAIIEQKPGFLRSLREPIGAPRTQSKAGHGLAAPSASGSGRPLAARRQAKASARNTAYAGRTPARRPCGEPLRAPAQQRACVLLAQKDAGGPIDAPHHRPCRRVPCPACARGSQGRARHPRQGDWQGAPNRGWGGSSPLLATDSTKAWHDPPRVTALGIMSHAVVGLTPAWMPCGPRAPSMRVPFWRLRAPCGPRAASIT